MKPRICKRGVHWWCIDHNAAATGPTPFSAWHEWLHLRLYQKRSVS